MSQSKTFFNKIGQFFKNLNKAYYVGAISVVSMLLLFAAWINVPMLSSLSSFLKDTPGISAITAPLGANISGDFSLPKIAVAFDRGIDQVNGVLNDVSDFFGEVSQKAEKLQDAAEQVSAIAPLLGISLPQLGVNAEELISNLSNTFFAMEQNYSIIAILNQVSQIVHTISFVIIFIFVVCLGLNIYAIVTTFFRKKITKGCIAAFITEGAICLLVIIGIFAVNLYAQSQVFFLDRVLAPTVWAWLTLISSILGTVFCLVFRKQAKKVSQQKIS